VTARIDAVFGDVWLRLPPWQRRALALVGHSYSLERRLARDEFVPWPELETADRMALIRAMRVIGELATECAEALDRARLSLDEHWREEVAQ
jgi:hypothetical protein